MTRGAPVIGASPLLAELRCHGWRRGPDGRGSDRQRRGRTHGCGSTDRWTDRHIDVHRVSARGSQETGCHHSDRHGQVLSQSQHNCSPLGAHAGYLGLSTVWAHASGAHSAPGRSVARLSQEEGATVGGLGRRHVYAGALAYPSRASRRVRRLRVRRLGHRGTVSRPRTVRSETRRP